MERVYQIGPCFREGEKGSRHNPEFTMLEWYRANADYNDIAVDMEALVGEVLRTTGTTGILPVATSNPFTRITVREAYLRWAGWDPVEAWDQDRFDFDMATKIEPNLPKGPLFLMDYPAPAASLARLKADDPRVAERWELYVDGLELANAFTELTDPVEQRRRFESARAERRALGEADYPLDEEFLDALARMPPSGGVALGVDRLVMLACGVRDITDVRFC
jgi:lysyl-tRNA synthetase class 2